MREMQEFSERRDTSERGLAVVGGVLSLIEF